MIFNQQDINRLQIMTKKMGIETQQRHSHAASSSPASLSSNNNITSHFEPLTWFVDLLEAIVEKVS